MAWLRRVAGLALALVVGVPLLLWGSARCSLDRELSHTRRVADLPLLAPTTTEGIVRIAARGHQFRARVAGLDHSGPALLLLHGFPETSIMWEALIQAASEQRFRVAAFDQRGYSPGARPSDVAAYALPELVDDALAVADALGFERFHLVGHDWGSVVGWALSPAEPERVVSWTSLSIPHPRAVAEHNVDAGTPRYIQVFRLPGVAETVFGAFDFFALRRVVYDRMPAPLLAEYLSVFSEPGALTASLDWYRAITPISGPLAMAGTPVEQPVLYVFGTHDMPVFVHPNVRVLQRPLIHGPYEELELDAGHWLIQEEPEAVLAAVMAHLRRHRDR